jgi:hypothetical protein
MGQQRLIETQRHRGQGRLVKDSIHTINGFSYNLLVSDIAFNDLDVVANWGQILAKPGAEIVQHSHVIAAFNQSRRDVRADKTGSSRNEHLTHERLLKMKLHSTLNAQQQCPTSS